MRLYVCAVAISSPISSSILSNYPSPPALIILPSQPKPPLRILILPQTPHHLLRAPRLPNNPLIILAHEPTAHRVLHPLHQPRPVPLHIKHHHGHAVDPQLVPRRDLHELLERPVPARQRDEAAPGPAGDDLPRHELLARVHVFHDGGAAVEGRVDVFLLEAHEGRGDDAVHAFWAGEGDEGPGDFAHQAHGAAAVDEVRAGGVQGVGQGARGGEVRGGGAGGGAAAGWGVSQRV